MSADEKKNNTVVIFLSADEKRESLNRVLYRPIDRPTIGRYECRPINDIAVLPCSRSAPLFSYMQKQGFLRQGACHLISRSAYVGIFRD